MKLDSGRLADMRLLEQKISQSKSQSERHKYRRLMDGIRHQAQNEKLADARENLLEARRRGDRQEADKLEGYIDSQHYQ